MSREEIERFIGSWTFSVPLQANESAANATFNMSANLTDGNETEDQANGTEVKVLDFGIARDLAGPSVTTTGVAVGTALYMAPEQATASKAVGPAADVWAMGVMLYEVLGGERPFDGPSAHAVVEAVTMPHRPLTELRADLSPGWGELVDACLAKKPEGRPSAAASAP